MPVSNAAPSEARLAWEPPRLTKLPLGRRFASPRAETPARQPAPAPSVSAVIRLGGGHAVHVRVAVAGCQTGPQS